MNNNYTYHNNPKSTIMRKFLFIALMMLPMSMMAQWQVVDADKVKAEKEKAKKEQPVNQPSWRAQTSKKKATEQKEEPTFTFGVYHTADFYKCAGAGLGLLCNYGRTSDLLNVSFGVEYIEYITGDPRKGNEKNGLGLVDVGGQIALPVILKLQLFKTSKWTKFYIGCGGELGFKARQGGVLKHYYKDDSAFRNSSFAVQPMLGWRARNVDFGFYCKFYASKLFNDVIDEDVSNLGEEKMRFGYHLTFWF